MLRAYRTVLTLPGGAAFSIAGLFARLPLSMHGIGIVLLVSHTTGSYGAAGVVTAVFQICQAVASPQLARLVDRRGQARVMRPMVLLHAAAVLGLVAVAQTGQVRWMLPVAAVMGASMGSMGSLVRARWVQLATEARTLHTAFALESVIDEVVFVVGPIVVTLLSTGVAAPAGLLVAAVAGIGGGVALLAQRATEPAPRARAEGRTRSVLRNGGVLTVAVTFLWVGAVFGAIDVSVVAFTEARGQAAAAGPVLALFALGSLVSGVVYGARHSTMSDGRRLQVAVVLLAAGAGSLVLVSGLVTLAVVAPVVGVTVAPLLIAGNAFVRLAVPPGRLTEGLAWVSTSLGIGVALGAAVSGWVIDAMGAHRGFTITLMAGFLALISVLAGRRWLEPR